MTFTPDSNEDTMKILMKKIKNSTLVIMLGFQNAKKICWRIHSKLISDLNGEKIAESFYEKQLLKTSQEKFRIEKVFKRKGDKLYVK